MQYVAAGVHESARVGVGEERWFTRLHGTETDLPRIRRSWTFKHGRFFSERESERGEQVVVLGSVVHDKLFGAGTDPVGAEVRIWNQPFRVVGVVTSTNWADDRRGRRRPVRRGVRAADDGSPAAQSDQAQQHHDHSRRRATRPACRAR